MIDAYKGTKALAQIMGQPPAGGPPQALTEQLFVTKKQHNTVGEDYSLIAAHRLTLWAEVVKSANGYIDACCVELSALLCTILRSQGQIAQMMVARPHFFNEAAANGIMAGDTSEAINEAGGAIVAVGYGHDTLPMGGLDRENNEYAGHVVVITNIPGTADFWLFDPSAAQASRPQYDLPISATVLLGEIVRPMMVAVTPAGTMAKYDLYPAERSYELTNGYHWLAREEEGLDLISRMRQRAEVARAAVAYAHIVGGRFDRTPLDDRGEIENIAGLCLRGAQHIENSAGTASRAALEAIQRITRT